MEISYLGHSSFLLKTKDCKIVTDPFHSEIGLKFPKTAADVVTISHNHQDHNNKEGVTGVEEGSEPMVFDWPGEFERKGARIFGFQSFHDTQKGAERGENIVYRFEMGGIHIAHLGDLGHLPDDKLIESIGDVDIVFIPVGGYFSLDPKQASDTIKKLDPAIVIPMHYAVEGLAPDLKEKMQPLSDFLKVMGVENIQPLVKYVVKKEDLVEKENEIVVLQAV